MTPAPDGFHDDLRDFVRHGTLDAYELPDDELAQLLEVWRWALWTKGTTPSAPDADARVALERLARHLRATQGARVDYNTRYVLLSEAVPLMHLRVLAALPGVLWYCANPRHWWGMLCAWRQARRYRRVKPLLGEQDADRRAYPTTDLQRTRLRTPDLLRRRYWRRIGDEADHAVRRHFVDW